MKGIPTAVSASWRRRCRHRRSCRRECHSCDVSFRFCVSCRTGSDRDRHPARRGTGPRVRNRVSYLPEWPRRPQLRCHPLSGAARPSHSLGWARRSARHGPRSTCHRCPGRTGSRPGPVDVDWTDTRCTPPVSSPCSRPVSGYPSTGQ